MPRRPHPWAGRGAHARKTIDLCPVCGQDMGGAVGGTRRIGLSSAQKGLFLWECPDCAGRWEESPGRPLRVLGRPGPHPVPPRSPVD